MKLLRLLIFLFLFASSGFAQNNASLDVKLSEMFKRNFSGWTAENGEKAFYPMIQNTWKFDPAIHKPEEASDLHSIWTKDKKRVNIMMKVVKGSEGEKAVANFGLRNVSPPSYKIKDVGSDATLVKFHNRVEIAFVKFNVLTRIYYDFPSRYKKNPVLGTAESVNAPQEEVDFLLKVARLIADEITEIQTTETLTGVELQAAAN
jgi:hypothetical protein